MLCGVFADRNVPNYWNVLPERTIICDIEFFLVFMHYYQYDRVALSSHIQLTGREHFFFGLLISSLKSAKSFSSHIIGFVDANVFLFRN